MTNRYPEFYPFMQWIYTDRVFFPKFTDLTPLKEWHALTIEWKVNGSNVRKTIKVHPTSLEISWKFSQIILQSLQDSTSDFKSHLNFQPATEEKELQRFPEWTLVDNWYTWQKAKGTNIKGVQLAIQELRIELDGLIRNIQEQTHDFPWAEIRRSVLFFCQWAEDIIRSDRWAHSG